jgi:hypothetical protein
MHSVTDWWIVVIHKRVRKVLASLQCLFCGNFGRAKLLEEIPLFMLQLCFKFTFGPKTFVWFKIDLEFPKSIKTNLKLHKSIV